MKMKNHPESWFIHQLAWCRQCIALADKVHTPQELADARAALDVAPKVRQARLTLEMEN